MSSCSVPVEKSPPRFADNLAGWTEHRETSLLSEEGWLNLVGLFWITEGTQTIGSAESSDFRLDTPATPERLGEFERVGGEIWFTARTDGVEVAGRPIERLQLQIHQDPPQVIEYASLRLFLIPRGDRVGLRVRDLDSPLLHDFEGLDRFPVDEDFNLIARFEAWEVPRTLPIPNVLGEPLDEVSPGRVHFEIGGQGYSLLALEGGETGDLFIIFGDLTNGETTYGAGRFVYTSPPTSDNLVALDFNRSYNPPCVFTPFATCPLPPPGNRLPISIQVGEKSWREH